MKNLTKLYDSIHQAETLAHQAIDAGGLNTDTDNVMPELDQIKKRHTRNFDKRAIERAFWNALTTGRRNA